MSCVPRSASYTSASSASPPPESFRRRNTNYSQGSPSRSASSSDGDEYTPLSQSDNGTALGSFNAGVEQAGADLRAFKRSFRLVRDESDKLLELHPNDLTTHTAAIELRDAINHLCATSTSLDFLLQSLRQQEQALRSASYYGDRSSETHRQETLDVLIDRFLRRMGDIKREARYERQERREAEDHVRPKALDAYLAVDEACVGEMLRTEAISAARYLVENPFTVLTRMDAYRSMSLAAVVKNADYWDADNDRTVVKQAKKARNGQGTVLLGVRIPPGVVSDILLDWTSGWMLLVLGLCLLSAGATAMVVVRTLSS